MSRTVIKPDRVVVGSGGVIHERMAVAVEDGRITHVAPEAELASLEGASVIDAAGWTLMPGMVDVHVHLAFSGSDDPRDVRLDQMSLDDERLALRAVAHAQETVRWGFTAVRDLHAPGRTVLGVRDAISAGWVKGPIIKACGQGLSVTGGHMDFVGDAAPMGEVSANVCDGPEAFRAGVREQVKRGADCIKINLCGGSMRDPEHPYKQEMTDEEVKAAIEEAHRLERHVAAHTSGGPSITMAVEAGLDSVEHGHWIDDRTADLMAERGTTYVPTLLVNERNFEVDRSLLNVSEMSWAWVQRAREDKWATLARLHRAGVQIAVGTDAGFMVPHGAMSAREIELLVQGGLSDLEALEAATSVGARLLGIHAGVIQVGARADFVLVDGNPAEDVRVLQDQKKLRTFLAGSEFGE